jgi:hypothetical protein
LGLLDLPPELWGRICHLAIVSSEPIDLIPLKDNDKGDEGPNRFLVIDQKVAEQPPLTHTCRTIRSECLPLFYKHNTFVAMSKYRTKSRKSITNWLHAIGPKSRQAIEGQLFVQSHWLYEGRGDYDRPYVESGVHRSMRLTDMRRQRTLVKRPRPYYEFITHPTYFAVLFDVVIVGD